MIKRRIFWGIIITLTVLMVLDWRGNLNFIDQINSSRYTAISSTRQYTYLGPEGKISTKQFTADRQLELEFDAQTSQGFLLENSFGVVEVNGYDENVIKIQAQATIYADTEEGAQRVAEEFELVYTNGDLVTVEAADIDKEHANFAIVEYHVYLPNHLQAFIANNYAPIEIDGLKGGLLVSGSYSNIKIRDVEGDLRVESHFGQVELANVNGDVALLSSFGSGVISNVTGSLRLRPSFDNYVITNVLGDLDADMQNSQLYLNDVSGKSEIKAQFGQIRCEGLANETRIETEFADVYLNLKDVKEGYSISITQDDGSIKTSLPIKKEPSGSDSDKYGYKHNDGKYPVDIQTLFATVNLSISK